MDLKALGEKHGLPPNSTEYAMPREVGERPVTRFELLNIVQALQKFIVAAAVVPLVSANNPDKLDGAVDELVGALAAVRRLTVALTEDPNG